jgi:hypothetical protein
MLCASMIISLVTVLRTRSSAVFWRLVAEKRTKTIGAERQRWLILATALTATVEVVLV